MPGSALSWSIEAVLMSSGAAFAAAFGAPSVFGAAFGAVVVPPAPSTTAGASPANANTIRTRSVLNLSNIGPSFPEALLDSTARGAGKFRSLASPLLDQSARSTMPTTQPGYGDHRYWTANRGHCDALDNWSAKRKHRGSARFPRAVGRERRYRHDRARPSRVVLWHRPFRRASDRS